MLSIPHNLKSLLTKAVLFSLPALFYACDPVDHDVTPGGPTVDLVGTEVIMLSNGSAYIDLYSKIKTNGTVRVDIASQPRKGDLSEVGTGFLKYSPDRYFTRGRDAFAFSIYDENNRLLKSDSLVIIVEDDSTNLPCGIYPQDDYVYHVTGPVQINVRENDILCADSMNLILEVYRPNNSFPPHAGTATVLSNNVIQYTPGSNFNGSDEFIYKVFSANDSSLVGFAVVHISSDTACNFVVNDDAYTFSVDSLSQYDSLSLDSIRYDSVRLYVLNNDILCDSMGTGHSFNIIQYPVHGTAYYNNNDAFIGYTFPHNGSSTSFTDSLVYRVCVDQGCKVGRVKINVH
jgi:hypothetical protein